jgi:hypothetical protein
MSVDEFLCGIPGSPQHLAYELRSAFNPPSKHFGLPPSPKDVEKWRQKLLEIKRAADSYDSRYFRRVADGLDLLHQLDYNGRDPRCLFLRAYFFLRDQAEKPPILQNVIDLTDRMRAVASLKGHVPRLPLPDYSPDFEEEIRLKIPVLPKQKWSRFYKSAELKFSRGRMGPKPNPSAKRRPKSK